MRSPRVVLGVGGGIAAYKAADLLRRLTESGLSVRVVPTAAALRFVGAPTWEALSGQPVAADVFADVESVPHLRLGRDAELVLVAPATADLLARAAAGRADDLLTAVLLTARCPVMVAPAMHTEMWEHPATRDNVATLRSRGVLVLDPAVGRLSGPDSGAGRLPEPAEIATLARRVLTRGAGASDLAGRHAVVTAGGTREQLDPVRYLGNNSSGKQGYAFAESALARGARVTLIAANVALPDPAGARVIRVGSGAEMGAAVTDALGEGWSRADALVMAAAPADFAPATYSASKIRTSDTDPEPIAVVRTADIAAAAGAAKPAGRVLVIFAAETVDGPTDDGPSRALAKLRRKNADLVVLNDVTGGAVFGASTTTVSVLAGDGPRFSLTAAGKDEVADRVWDAVAAALTPVPGAS